MTAADMPIENLLAGLGLTGEAADEGRRILEAEGITNPRKSRIAKSKEPRAREAIDRRLRRLCHHCGSRAEPDPRPVVAVPPAACAMCGGSSNRRAVDELTAACREAGLSRLLVVGGSPALRRDLAELVGDRLELRLVDGTRVTDKGTGKRDVAWADLVVVLGSSELAHKVSRLYTNAPEARAKTIVSSRRGIAALADEITRCDAVRGRRG